MNLIIGYNLCGLISGSSGRKLGAGNIGFKAFEIAIGFDLG